jgi:NADPH-dependent ferric siderophore reductase
MAQRPPPRLVEVRASTRITRNMLRITLGGAGLADFPANSAGGYIKLRLFPDGPGTPVVVRTYTVRHQRASEIDVDFALHADASGSHGPATDWALSVWPGDTIEIGGPGPAKPLPAGQDFYLLGGDMTALPAISVNLEALAADARGHVVFEIQHAEDAQDLTVPAGVTVEWLVNRDPGSQPELLAERLRAAMSKNASVYAWVASEFGAMRAARAYLREECGLTPQQLYISSYWKRGLTEEAHKVAKREDSMTGEA